MNRFAAIVLLVIAVALFYRSFGSAETGTGSLTLAQPAPNIGSDARTFETESLNRNSFELRNEGVYVLTFWSTLNKGSNDARPEFTELAQQYRNSGVSFAAVYVNSAPQETTDVPYTVIQDSSGRLTSLYNVKRVPRLFVIRDGKIALVHDGYYKENEAQLRGTLEKILEEKNASPG